MQPERHSSTRIATRKQQRPRCVHSEACAKQRCRAYFFHHQLLRFGPRQPQQRLNWRAHPQVRQSKHDPVVGGLHLKVDIVHRFAHAFRESHPPRRVDPSAECCMNHHAHGAGFVSELLDDDVLVVGHDPRDCSLRRDVLHQRACRSRITPVLLGETLFVRRLGKLPAQRPHPMTEHQRSRHVLAVPERHSRRRSRCRRDDDPIVLDGSDSPGR